MAESELKLDTPCRWCGTPNAPGSARCRHCFQDLEERVAEERAEEGPALFDMARPPAPCPACGKVNMLSTDKCLECGASMRSGKTGPLPEPTPEPAGLKAAARARRRAIAAPALHWGAVAFWVRLGSVLFLFWSILDTGTWLANVTSGLKADNPVALRYNTFAVYELLRNFCLVAGLWLLTLLRLGRQN